MNRCIGWVATVESGPGWRRLLIVNRQQRRTYTRLEYPGGASVREVTKHEARGWYSGEPMRRVNH